MFESANYVSAQKRETIFFAHLGLNDRYWRGLIMSTRKIYVPRTYAQLDKVIVTDNRTFDCVVAYLKQHHADSFDISKRFYEKGCFRIAYYIGKSHFKTEPNYIIDYRIPDRIATMKYFKNLNDTLKSIKADTNVIRYLEGSYYLISKAR